MTFVSLNEGESIEGLLRRFRNAVARSGLLREVKERRFYRSKSEKARMAAQRAARKHRRRAAPA